MMYRKLFLIVFLVCFNYFNSFSQSINRSYNLVLELPTFTEEKTLPYLLDVLSTTTGVTLKEYCAFQGWIVLEVNNERFSCTDDPMLLLKQLHIEGILKVGATKEQVEAYCKGGLITNPTIKK